MRELDARFYLAHWLGTWLTPFLHMTSSENLGKWQNSGMRQDLSQQGPLCPLPSLSFIWNPFQGGSHLFSSSFLCIWPVVLLFWRICLQSAKSLAHAGQPWDTQVGHFLGRWTLLLPGFPSLSELKCEEQNRYCGTFQVVPGSHRESQGNMMSWSLSFYFPSPH